MLVSHIGMTTGVTNQRNMLSGQGISRLEHLTHCQPLWYMCVEGGKRESEGKLKHTEVSSNRNNVHECPLLEKKWKY